MASVRERRISRIQSAMPFAEELHELTTQAHAGASFHIDRGSFEATWYATPFTRSRDSGPLDESNWYVITGRLSEEFPESVTDKSFGHWAHGWYERLYVRRDDALAIRAVQKWVDFLSDYPVADDIHFSETEWNHNHPSDTECYSTDPDCECDVKSHSCRERFGAALECGAIGADDTEWHCVLCGESYEIDGGFQVERDLWLARLDHEDKQAKGQLILLAV